MMSCAEVRPILSFLIEKETGPLETLEARRHLDGCVSCRARADRLSVLMTACGNLPCETPPSDLTSTVMQRLRSMKTAATRAGARGLAPATAKWGGLVALLGAGLALVARPAVPVLKALGAPLVMLAGMLGDPESPSGATDVAGRAVAAALQYAGVALKPEWATGAGIDGTLTFQLLATAMTIAFLLAIPAGVLTAWFLHEGAARHRFPHL
jgi:putative zinc finger protein